MSVPAAVATSLLSAGAGVYGSNSAADAQKDAAKRAQQTALRNYLMQLQAQEPARYTGYQALGDINSALGYTTPAYADQNALARGLTPLGTKEALSGLKSGLSVDQISQMGTIVNPNAKTLRRLTKAGLSFDQIKQLQGMPQAQTAQPAQTGNDFSRFMDSPDYGFRRSEGERGIGNSFAARGGAASGNALRALTEFNSNLAAGEFGNWFNRRMGLAGMGQQATGAVGNAGNQTANAMMGLQQGIGDSRASGVMGAANSITGAVNSGMNNYLMGQYYNNQSPQYTYPGSVNLPGGDSINPRLPNVLRGW
jgi:hypothetical protein